MLVYEGIKTDFMQSVVNDTIAEEIEKKIQQIMHKRTAKNEFRSWINSMEYMYKVLNDHEIPEDAGIAIEYNIPQTSKRVDFLISGYDKYDKENVIVIELKQWDEVEEVSGLDGLVETYVGGAKRKVVHPSYQAWSYAQLIQDYNVNVQENNIKLHPCAYMHNYRRVEKDPIDSSIYKIYLDDAPVFTKGQVQKLREFIKKSVVKGDGKQILYKIENGKIKPSKSLQNEISSMLEGNQEFIMIDDQKVVYEEILKISKTAVQSEKKNVIIVEGGPGTGKSVLAINLLAKLTQEDQFVQYVSKNTAPRSVYFEKLKGKRSKTSVSNMFKGSGSYVDASYNVLDTLIVDEAHRLTEKSGFYKNEGENQIKEIIHACKCSVFFIDEEQRVTFSDIGSISEIEKWANLENANIIKLKLNSQFRCNGSDGYLSWLDHVLEIKETANFNLEGIDYDIQVLNTPNEVRDMIFEKNKFNNRSRILAGYCWEWPTGKSRNDTNYHEIEIGDFKMSWNLERSTYATDENSVHEIGCVHTTQGLEFDYIGVIIGNDLRFENGRIITDFNERAKSDKSLSGIKGLYKKDKQKALEIADMIIKNTYRTLMTRGMKGCYIYCCDPNLATYLKEMINLK